ncbi:MAG: glycosyltransferase family 39 protein [Myxococcales bacterium]|jgi:hypothetical protein|nr:glycosyltransferase family 39 protein [Myxococcales bacterium]
MTWTTNRCDALIAFALALITLAALLIGEHSIGFMRDEGVYFEAGRRYAAWFADDLLAFDGTTPFSDEVIRCRFEFNREHPALMKSLFGLSERLFTQKLGLMREATGFRLPAILFSALLSALLFLLGRHVTTRRAALFAVLGFWLVPRTFFHGALACFDMPIACAWLLTVVCYRHAITARTACSILGVGLAFGLALSIKHNAWIIPGVLLIHWALTEIPKRRCRDLPRTLLPFASMLLIGPLTLLATWPFLWHHPIDRFLWYARFHTRHINYPWEFLGQLLVEAPFPPGYALVLTGLTVPIALLALMLTGSIHEVARFAATYAIDPIRRRFGKPPLLAEPLDSDSLLLLGNGFASLFVFSMPFVPIFGGVKHWLPAMPFLCLFAARALERLSSRLEACAPSKMRRAIFPALTTLVLLPALIGLIRIHPYGTSFYNELAGGPAGGASLGMHRQYWSNNVTGVFEWLNANAPQGARVYLHEVTLAAFQAYQKNEMLRGDLKYTSSIGNSLIAAYQYMPEFRDIEFQIWNSYGTQTPVTGLYLDETPQIVVYWRP